MAVFFENFVGRWKLDGLILGKPLEQEVTVDRVLGGRYLRIHYLPSTVTPLNDEPYECLCLVGRDGERYVMYLFDTFGGGETVQGYGTEADGKLCFEFAYPLGPFFCCFERQDDGWSIDLQGTGEDGKLHPFGVKRLSRI